ncbi:MAG: DUF4198 domain-containing protein [Comamonadaceae bacterium]|nr:MAG: DUF4198 domain-containing protein [Comamonadaceae bacterium]
METGGQRVTAPLRCVAIAAALASAALAAAAHDSWLSPSERPVRNGRQLLELSTGNRYPVQEFNPTAASLVRAQCSDGGAAPRVLRPERDQPKFLELQAAVPRGRPALACWLEIKPFDLVMEQEKVEVYFAEIRPPQALREAWAGMQARGVAWQESYRKFARIELATAAAASAQQRAAARKPVGLDLEIVVLGDAPITVGQPLEFQVLREGRPLAGFPVELVSERSPLGVWGETDKEGRLRHTLPFGGRWLLRGTDLRLAPQDRWSSLFVTLAIEAPAARAATRATTSGRP